MKHILLGLTGPANNPQLALGFVSLVQTTTRK